MLGSTGIMQTATNAGTDDGVAVLGVPRRPLAQARRVALCLSVVLALGMGTASSAWASGSIIGWGDVAKVDRGLDLGQVNAIAPVATCESGTSGACPEGPYLTGVEEVSAGNGFSLARLSGGRVLTWSGLGDGLDSVPVLLCAVGVAAPCPSGPYLEHVTEISAGTSSGEHALALLSDGQVVSWGTGNPNARLGRKLLRRTGRRHREPERRPRVRLCCSYDRRLPQRPLSEPRGKDFSRW